MTIRLGLACRHYVRGLRRLSPRPSGLAQTVKVASSYGQEFRAVSSSTAMNRSTASVKVASSGRNLILRESGGDEVSYHPVWLRHNCQCPSCFSINQKIVDPCDIDPKVTVESANVSDSQLNLVWSNGHHGYIELDWLRKRRPRAAAQQSREDSSTPNVAKEFPVLSAASIAEDNERLWKWLQYINEYGVCLLTDLETDEEAIKKLVKQTLYNVQPTVYGEMFDVVSMENSHAIAYTTQQLVYHMDQQFYESPPGLQLLHCLKFDDCVEGGESIMLDMFPVVEELREKHPQHFNTLTRVPATFERIHYDRLEPVDIVRQAPHIQLDGFGKVVELRWTPCMEGPLDVPLEDIEPYFEAHYCLAHMLNNSQSKLTHRLRPGEVMTFNNRRMVHSRNEFILNGGQRHLKGIYVNIDHFWSKLRVLHEQLQKTDTVRRVFNANSN